ncbi:hypothetical protein [Halococcus thailandensis]|uniref:hypothetical protein n=1 Tax=Halococcus thailandensis TaxID=335952 RepID=UPI0013756E71|nr:hypothetical protein [Halococcus thailandensis]
MSTESQSYTDSSATGSNQSDDAGAEATETHLGQIISDPIFVRRARSSKEALADVSS